MPHYRLRDLHDAMLQFPDYRSSAVEVDGVVRPPKGAAAQSLVAVLGAESAREADGAFIDSSVLDEHEVTERDAIAAEEQASSK